MYNEPTITFTHDDGGGDTITFTHVGHGLSPSTLRERFEAFLGAIGYSVTKEEEMLPEVKLSPEDRGWKL